MNKKAAIGVLTATLVAFTQLGSSCSDKDVVEEKLQISVPGSSVPCYFLEVERQDSAGEETGETSVCVEKAEWDRNKVGNEWVDANGVLK